MPWICCKCTAEKAEQRELPDGRLRPYCAKCAPPESKPYATPQAAPAVQNGVVQAPLPLLMLPTPYGPPGNTAIRDIRAWAVNARASWQALRATWPQDNFIATWATLLEELSRLSHVGALQGPKTPSSTRQPVDFQITVFL